MLLLDKILQLRIIWYAMAFPAIYLTHWGWVMHICVSKLTIIGSDNGLSPGWLQAIIWTNTAILLIGPLVNKLQWNLKAKLMHFHWRKMHFKKSSAKWRAFCFNPNVLKKKQKKHVTSPIENEASRFRFLLILTRCVFKERKLGELFGLNGQPGHWAEALGPCQGKSESFPSPHFVTLEQLTK